MLPLSFVVDRRESGKTLAAVLKLRYGITWSQAKRLVEGRHVKVAGQVEADVARRLKPGKRVELSPGTLEIRSAGKAKGKTPEKLPARPVAKAKPAPPSRDDRLTPTIVYADDAVAVVDKPAGLTTMRHREEAAEFGPRGKTYLPKTLADLIPRLLGAPGRPVFAVHRIDRDTSGLVVFARTRSAAEKLTAQFRKHTVDRWYLALTRGVPAAGRIESVLVRDRGDGRRGTTRKTSPADGKRAVTHVKVLERMGEFTLVECRLETGRTHQVRIHLGEAGTPLCGETVYDRPVNGKPASDGSPARRPMLHAARLGFAHPESGDGLTWEAPVPADFQAVAQWLRDRRKT